MKIEKALKKEETEKKIFFILMTFLFIMIPLVTYLAGLKSIFIWTYVIIINFLIVIAILIKINYHRLKFKYIPNRLRIKTSLFLKESIIICDKVAVVHTNKNKEELEIIIITTMKFKNRQLKPITPGFIKKYPEASEQYLRVKKLNPENVYYFQVIRRGALRKYILLDVIYKNCVMATYTSSAIENIKISRGQIDI